MNTVILSDLGCVLLSQELVVERINVHGRKAARWVRLEEAHDVATGLHAVLSVASVDFPASWCVTVSRYNNAGLVHTLKIGQGLSLAQVARQVVCVCL